MLKEARYHCGRLVSGGNLGNADAAASNNAGIWDFDAVDNDDVADQVHRKGSISQYSSETVVL